MTIVAVVGRIILCLPESNAENRIASIPCQETPLEILRSRACFETNLSNTVYSAAHEPPPTFYALVTCTCTFHITPVS